LREFASRKSEAAFAELARRHVDLVYSAALRMVCDAHLAQDVTQGVFIALAQSARQLADRPVLSGWLHRTAQNIASNTVRSEVRRRAREEKAVAMNELLGNEPDATWEMISPQLDAALGELDEADRDALMLRYFERKSAREMAAILGTSEEAAQIVADLRKELAGDGIEFFNGVSYRHLMMWRGGVATTHLTPPHDITGKPVEEHLPKGAGADLLRDLTRRSAAILREHPVNQARRAAGKAEASSIWFWGQGTRPSVPTLKERFGVDGSVISAVDLVNGLGRLAGLNLIKVPGATGFLDTDYAAKGRYGLESLKSRDFLLLHIEAPDEAGHMGRADLKKEAIERIDELIIGPMLQGLGALGDFAILLMPDHATPSQLKTHSPEPVPFALMTSAQFKSGGGAPHRYTEDEGTATGVLVGDGYHLIESLFGGPLITSSN